MFSSDMKEVLIAQAKAGMSDAAERRIALLAKMAALIYRKDFTVKVCVDVARQLLEEVERREK